MLLNEIGEVAQLLPMFRRKLERSKALVRRALSEHKAPYIAISGGKDSIAMLGIVSDVAREMRCDNLLAWAHLSNANYPGTTETIREACGVLSLNAPYGTRCFLTKGYGKNHRELGMS